MTPRPQPFVAERRNGLFCLNLESWKHPQRRYDTQAAAEARQIGDGMTRDAIRRGRTPLRGSAVLEFTTDAKGLVASSDSDVDNLYIVLSARTARPETAPGPA